MVTARKVALLGFVTVLIWEDEDGNQAIARWPRIGTRSQRARLALTTNTTGTAIYLLPWAGNVKRGSLPRGADGQKKRFQTWSEFRATEAFKITIKKDTLFLCGKPLRLEYESDKWTGKPTIYFHNFKKAGCKLYVNRGNVETFGILQERGQTIVSARGIIG